jgi:multiple sugar transport system ATP-binding protein
MSSVRLEQISKRFGGVTAVDDVSLSIAPKEFVTLLGPSGCGKSTILNVAAGLERPTGGRVVIEGRDVTALSAGERDIAMVFQSYALYPHLNVAGNLAFPLRVKRQPKAEIARRVGEIAELMEIGPLLQRKPRELSGGQRQRVAIGRAIIRSSSVCLLDEPLSNLDAALRVRMRAELKLLFARMGTTILFVTHDQAEAMTMSDRIVILRDGHVQQQGTPLAIYREPANVFVATFIGSPQMNILKAELAAGAAGEAVVRAGALVLPLPAELAARVQAAPRRDVLLGLRPEDLSVGAFERAARFPAAIELVEHLGNGAIVHYTASGLPKLVGLETRDLSIGAGWQGEAHVNLDGIRLFDARTVAAI